MEGMSHGFERMKKDIMTDSNQTSNQPAQVGDFHQAVLDSRAAEQAVTHADPVPSPLPESVQKPDCTSQPTEWPHPMSPRTVVPESADKTPRPEHGPVKQGERDEGCPDCHDNDGLVNGQQDCTNLMHDRLMTLAAAMYQIAGANLMPMRIMDTLSVIQRGAWADPSKMLPYGPEENGREWTDKVPINPPSPAPSQPELPPLDAEYQADRPWEIAGGYDNTQQLRCRERQLLAALRENQQLRQRIDEFSAIYEKCASDLEREFERAENLQQQLAQIKSAKSERPQGVQHGNGYVTAEVDSLLDQQDAQIAALRLDNAQKVARIVELEGATK